MIAINTMRCIMEKKKNVSKTLRLTREDAEKYKLNAI